MTDSRLSSNITYKTEEREIQKGVAGVQAVTSVVFSCITVLVVLFIGPWSDTYGRKIPLLVSTIGLILMPTMMIVGYLCLGKIRAVYIALLAMLPTTLTGGATVYSMSAGSYICDTTTPKNRTVRMGVFWASVRSSAPIGYVLGGLLMKFQVGIIKSLLIPVGLSGIALLIVLFKIQVFKMLFQQRENPWRFYLLILVHIFYVAPGVTYAIVYRNTVSYFAGAFYLLSAGITIPAEIIFV
ncbi:proton-coupled folate transporter-like [Folsomia candida]|uniref:proton-coupled folate transporter-like n=1 Tax=Folsomia candida TaxID=158441 RepID=UPI001605507B|nr:proton-coupled folate transporter-like [Folsomia candida]